MTFLLTPGIKRLIGSSSITEFVYTFDKSYTRLPSFDEVMNTAAATAAADDDDDEAAANEVALLLDDGSCSSLNESALTPNDKGSVNAEPPDIWTNLS